MCEKYEGNCTDRTEFQVGNVIFLKKEKRNNERK